MPSDAPSWTAIEADYRDGQMSIRELARFHGIPESTIRARAQAGGWERKPARHITDAEIIAAGGRAISRKRVP